MRTTQPTRRRLATTVLLAVVATAVATVMPTPAAFANDPVPAYIRPDANWLSVVNYYRSMARLPAVTASTTLSAGAYNHSCYMLYNGMTHDEIVGRPGYTTSGDSAGNRGNIAVHSTFGALARQHIEMWMTGPFHAIGVLRHNLASVGFGKCDNQSTSPWRSAATLEIISGLVTRARPTSPIVFPGNGTTTGLSKFITETPNPVSMCGWTGGAGLPVIAMMPEAVSSATASITGPSGPLQVCRLFSGNTSGVGRDILASENAVTVLPRYELSAGTYTVTITTQARTVKWSFTVDPQANTGIMPTPVVTTTAAPSRFVPTTPFRLVDTRSGLRATKLLANVPTRIRVTGVAGVPTGATALSANVTVLGAPSSGHLRLYPCSSTAPTASTINYVASETVANAGLFPLGTGDLCALALTDLHLLLDVNGWFVPSTTLTGTIFSATTPTPVLDTQSGLGGTAGVRPAGSVTTLNLRAGSLPIPDSARAVALLVAAVDPLANGHVTVYPCDASLPTTSNINVVTGATRQNLVIVPVAADGSVCIFVLRDMQLRADLLGWFAGDAQAVLTPTTPTRLIDTRDTSRPALNFGLGGAPLAAGVTYSVALAGQRGIPTGTTALSLNATVVPGASAGQLTVWPCDSSTPAVTSTFTARKTVATGVQVALSSTGEMCVRSTVATHLVIDLTGFWKP